jgi:hypothetical protein
VCVCDTERGREKADVRSDQKLINMHDTNLSEPKSKVVYRNVFKYIYSHFFYIRNLSFN